MENDHQLCSTFLRARQSLVASQRLYPILAALMRSATTFGSYQVPDLGHERLRNDLTSTVSKE